MDADLVAAADALAVQKLQAQDYRDEVARVTAAQAQAAADLAAFRAATLKAQADQLAAFQATAAHLHSKDEETWLRLYEMHLKVRLGPAIITSSTTDAIQTDMVNDAFAMTQTAFAAIKAAGRM